MLAIKYKIPFPKNWIESTSIEVLLEDLKINDLLPFKCTPFTFVGVERSLSTYKTLLADWLGQIRTILVRAPGYQYSTHTSRLSRSQDSIDYTFEYILYYVYIILCIYYICVDNSTKIDEIDEQNNCRKNITN